MHSANGFSHRRDGPGSGVHGRFDGIEALSLEKFLQGDVIDGGRKEKALAEFAAKFLKASILSGCLNAFGDHL
jgi:hypothetical protein